MVPMQTLTLKHNVGKYGKYHEAYTLLYNFQLYQIEGPSVGLKTDSVGRNLTAIFKKCYSP